MLVLLHVLIPCLAAYILHLFSYFLALLSLHPSAFNGNVRGGGGGGVRMLVLLHVLIPCLAAYILHLFSYFLALLSLHPSAFNGNVLCFTSSLLFHCILACKYNALCVCASPTHFAARGHVKRT